MERRVSLIAVCLLNLCLFFGGVTLAVGADNQSTGSAERNWEVVEGSVVIKNTPREFQKRNWVFVKCDHWAGCYMRCIGRLNDCEHIAKTVDWKEIYLFSDKAQQSPHPVKK